MCMIFKSDQTGTDQNEDLIALFWLLYMMFNIYIHFAVFVTLAFTTQTQMLRVLTCVY